MMLRSVLHALVLILLPVWLPLGAAEDAADVFRAGAATADLTPPQGVSMDGAISKPGPALGVHDPLHARALVMDLGETTVAIVINDLCMIDREVCDAAKGIVRSKLDLPPQNLLIAATHTHAAPRVMRISTTPPDERYRELVARRIADAVLAAHKQLAPARIAFASFERPEMIASRRYLCQPGSVGVNPFGETGERVKSVAGRSSEVIGPACPIDPEVSVLSVRHVDGTPLAVLANFSGHYTGGYEAGMVSADYFATYAERLRAQLGGGERDAPFVGIMSNGTSGATGAVRVDNAREPAWEHMRRAGHSLADQTADVLVDLPHEVPDVLDSVATDLTLEVRKPDADRVAWARELLANPGERGPHNWSRIYAQETLYLNDYPQHYEVPLQAIRIGDIGIAALPCEAFAETGLAVKADSPLENTFTVALANGYSGYLPTAEQHALGGYETWAARTSHLEVEAEGRIRRTLIKLLGHLER